MLSAVLSNPLADGVVGDAVRAPDGPIASRLDLREELLVWRSLNLSLALSICPGNPLATVSTAVTLLSVPRAEIAPTESALTRGSPVLPAAVCVERRSAIRAQDAQVLEPMIIGNSVDVVKNQRELASIPVLTLAARFTSPSLETFVEETPLDMRASIG